MRIFVFLSLLIALGALGALVLFSSTGTTTEIAHSPYILPSGGDFGPAMLAYGPLHEPSGGYGPLHEPSGSSLHEPSGGGIAAV